ncbi:MAG: right-handed parallel beta-helix repeat-containing protein [Bacteroidetes bacterium]|nr:right-handed parallel beta-helix repeat-containing protein [Bacteroidota bacterium]
MKAAAYRMWHIPAIIGLIVLSFDACKKETTVQSAPAGTADTSFKISTPIVFYNKSNITISGISTTSIMLVNCSNISIVNCKVGNSANAGITINGCSSVTVRGTYLYNLTTGVYAVDSQAVNVSGNFGLNMRGPFPSGQFVQFDNVTGPGNHIDSNKFQNIPGQSNGEDAISIYQSSGTPDDPLHVNHNEIRGGGPSNTGSGIMVGDGGGSYITANRNILVDPGQCGIGIAGGTNITVSENKIYGKKQTFTNVGLYYWNQSGKPSSVVTISNNAINFTASNGQLNNAFLATGDAIPTGWNTNYLDLTLSESTLPATLFTLP